MTIRRPFNFQQWIDEHRHLLKPPVGNQCVYDADDFIVMVVGGPNSRKDYHWDEGEEFFYQLEGDITVQIQEDGQAVNVPIRQGEMFLLPPRVPHNPVRGADTIGLVIERKRRDGEKDGLLWPQMSDLKFWESEAVSTYHFNSILFNVLIDPDGKIIAHGLRGEDLEKKLTEVLQ